MTRRLLVSNLVLITTVLLILEVPLAVIYGRHEHDAFNAAIQRDVNSLGAVSEEIVEHPAGHDVSALAHRFAVDGGGRVVILDRTGAALTPKDPVTSSAAVRSALRSASAGRASSSEAAGQTVVAAPVGPPGSSRGAVLIRRSDAAVDRRVHQFWLLLAGVGISVLFASVLISRRLARWATRPLRQLDAHATQLGRGALDTRADPTSGPPEVAALARTFNEMAHQLDHLITSQRRFVADASHQLRTPLTALRLRLENLDANRPNAVATTREAALAETARLTRLVDGLLVLARAEGSRPQRQPVDVRAVVAQRHEAWAPFADEHGIELRLENGHGALMASLVPGQLEQILDNLINNALDATPPGRSVRLATARAGPAIAIHTVDEGRGMTGTERERAFDPFWQHPDGHSNGGTGLGLAIVAQLATANDATVTLRSSESGGIDATVEIRPLT